VWTSLASTADQIHQVLPSPAREALVTREPANQTGALAQKIKSISILHCSSIYWLSQLILPCRAKLKPSHGQKAACAGRTQRKRQPACARCLSIWSPTARLFASPTASPEGRTGTGDEHVLICCCVPRPQSPQLAAFVWTYDPRLRGLANIISLMD